MNVDDMVTLGLALFGAVSLAFLGALAAHLLYYWWIGELTITVTHH